MAAKKKDPDHVTWKPPGTLLCLHCGSRYDMALPAPVEMVTAMMKSFEKTHGRCVKRPEGEACHLCASFGHMAASCPATKYAGDPKRWLHGPDTGLSSITIWHVMMGQTPHNPSEPLDPDDFGRCYRLLKAFPAWRARIGEMASVRGWERLAPEWDALEKLFEEEVAENTGRAPRLYARMRQLEAERRSGHPIGKGQGDEK